PPDPPARPRSGRSDTGGASLDLLGLELTSGSMGPKPVTVDVLAHPERLRLFAAIALAGTDGRSVADAAAAVGIEPRDAAKNCGRLVAAGLVSASGDWLVADPAVFRHADRQIDVPAGLPASLFDASGRLVTVPRDARLREVVLSWLADGFEPSRRYTETEVNA